MTRLAPKWALSAQAIDAHGHPYLAPGVHLRLFPSAEIGLPIAPFMVYRQDVTYLLDSATRSDVIWTDAVGQVLTMPFRVPAGQSVTGWLPPTDQGVCCWIQVQVERMAKEGIRMEGLVHQASLPLPPRSIGSTTQLPLTLSASRIDRVVVTGDALIYGVRWLDTQVVIQRTQPKFWRLLALPTASGPRYTSLPNAVGDAEDRVQRGTPPQMGRHEELTDFFASTGGVSTPADELDRINLFRPDLEKWLEQLVYDLSQPQQALTLPYTVQADGARPMAREQMDINTLGLLMQTSIEPGLARYLGFMDTDDEVQNWQPGSLVAYLVRGLFRFDKERHSEHLRTWSEKDILGFEQAQAVLKELGLSLDEQKSTVGGVLDFTTVAIATIGAPPDAPLPPQLRQADTSGPFLPMTPPEARREVVLRGDNLASLIALARRDSRGVASLNPLAADKRRALPLVPAVPNPGNTDAQGEFADREAPPERVQYQMAQADWFGRWSTWADIEADEKARPLPPSPVLTAHYTPLEVTDSTPLDQPLGGTLRVEIPVPPLESLPAGGFPLRQVRLTVREGATPVLTQIENPGDPHRLSDRKLIIRLTNHAALRLGRTAQRRVAVVAEWEDTAGQRSNPSQPVELTLVDPRPPAVVTIPDTLLYSARPDVSGVARVQLRWPIAPTQRRFRVYYADENGVVAYLRSRPATDAVASAALAAINAALTPERDAVALATAFKAHGAALPPALFDQLTREPLSFSGSTASFTHDLSGSLQVLSLYRVVAVSENNVEASFEASALVPVAVPNTAPPTQPFLTLRTIPAATRPRPDQIELVLEAARRPTRPIRYRLRRSTVGSADVLSMPIVATGDLPAPEDNTIRLVLSQGMDEPDTLRPWIDYFWRVEVQGESEPGALAMAGQWSIASAPVTAMFIPPAAPAPGEGLTLEATATAHLLRWRHSDPRLNGGTLGRYQFEIFQQKPGDRPRAMGQLSALAAAADGGRSDPAAEFMFNVPEGAWEGAIAGTLYRLTLVDPLKRVSAAVTVAVPAAPEPPPPSAPAPPVPPSPRSTPIPPSPASPNRGMGGMFNRLMTVVNRLLRRS